MQFHTPDVTDPYWATCHSLPLFVILHYWCPDGAARASKLEALLSACERGEVDYSRGDNKDFDDPVRELAARRILRIDRATFETWVIAMEGGSPLPPLVRMDRPVQKPAFSRPRWMDNTPVTPAAPTSPTATGPLLKPAPAPALPPRPAWANNSAEPALPQWLRKRSGTSTSRIAPDAPAAESPPPDHPPCVNNATLAPEEQRAPAPSSSPTVAPITSREIIPAFLVLEDEAANAKWWNERMRNAKRYDLVDARVTTGRLHTPSTWNKEKVILWLYQKGHLKTATLRSIIVRKFPDCDHLLEKLID